ncbi:tyrosyl-DNA phosphodiesterase-domain-containing protein [Mycena belliarum]|uniref:Tyrosyl-DNA phosphodiesterase-domain-containing protein n=1 Tax=Mycena belliarum TaxID=1033014 RepID=A0AAD6U0L6_9AGAR|nr:tyrosyl-DNA phosphodiesterase-domain-containing protein [Mycena belliae]
MSSRDRASASKANPIVVDDSETEDDSGDEILPSTRTGPGAATSQSPAPNLDSATAQTGGTVIVVDDLETEDDSNAGMPKLTKSVITAKTSGGDESRIPLATSAGRLQDKDQRITHNFGPLASLPDRAQMETERLARRKRALDTEDPGGASKRPRKSNNMASSTPLASRMFYDGAFFPTPTEHATPRADGREAMSLQDILGPVSNSDLKFAIMSSYGCSPEWLQQHFHSAVPVILVSGTGTEDKAPSMRKLTENWIQTCPTLSTGGVMHMKYMVLFYRSGRLRVVISTANLIPLDWTKLENAVFIQDLYPKSANVIGTRLAAGKSTPGVSGSKTEDSFATILENVLKKTNVGPALQHLKQTRPDIPLNSIEDLSKFWDWTSVTAELVPSISGRWEGWERIVKNGHPRLLRAIKTLGVATSGNQKLIVECQGSSIGMYSTQWFNQFYLSASGHLSALKDHMDLSEGRRKKLEYPRGVKVVFPSLATVKSTSKSGTSSLFCTRKKWDGKNFPRAAFHDSNSRAGRVLMHTKMIIGSFSQLGDAKKAPGAAGWMYLGSHNFTSPAWGNLSGSEYAPVLNVNNFELGVVVPLATIEDVDTASAWERPPRKYTTTDLPWIMEENLALMDLS